MIVLVMGVSGSGKTTIGERLAARLGCGFSDADQFHSEENKAKMAQGIALNDDDRLPWLEAMRAAIAEQQRLGNNQVFACSALKRSYRDLLRRGSKDLRVVFLDGPAELLAERVRSRRGHFFAPQLLQDQLDNLERPTPDEALVMDIQQTPDEIVEAVTWALQQS